MIITCDKWKAYGQTIKQLIAFDRRHLRWVEVTQAEKYYLIISASTSSFFVKLTGDFRKKIMLICTCLKLGGKDAGNNINCSLSHLNVNENSFVHLGARRHTLEPSQHIFQKQGLISIYWSATKHNFYWNDNAWMIRFSLSKNCKNSTARGGRHFCWRLETPQLPLWRTYVVYQHHRRWNDSKSKAGTCNAKQAPYVLTDGEWRALHCPALVPNRLWQVSRSGQSDESHR